MGTSNTITVSSPTGKPVLLTFSGFDLDDFENGVGQFQVLVNGHLVVDIPAGLNHLTGSGDYAPYTDTWVAFGPFDITSFVVQGQNTIVFQDPLSSHFGLVRNVTIIQGNIVLLHVVKASAVFPGHPTTYTFSIPPLIITSFTVSPASPRVNQAATFTATYTGGTAPFTCFFRFGDEESMRVAGSSGTCSTSHDYDFSGTFTVRVKVVGGSTSDVQTARLRITVIGSPALMAFPSDTIHSLRLNRDELTIKLHLTADD
jgi:PKD repeat protein